MPRPIARQEAPVSEPVSILLAADPRVEGALARLRSVVPEASLDELVRASVLHMGEAVPDHEISIYVREQVNLSPK
jgi:hypothetical protein